MCVFIAISISVITYYKMTNPETYALYTNNQESFLNIDFIGKILSILVTRNLLYVAGIYCIFAAGLLLLTYGLYFSNGFSKNQKKNTNMKNYILSIGLTYGFIIAIYIGYIFSNKE
jgi:hypothetical protein